MLRAPSAGIKRQVPIGGIASGGALGTLFAARSVTLEPFKDTATSLATPTTPAGNSAQIALAGATSATPGYGLLSFDLSAVPPSLVPTRMVLSFTVATTNASLRDYEVYALKAGNGDWVETTATYNTKDGTTAWLGGASGGGLSGTDHETTVLGKWGYVASAAAGTTYRIILDPQQVARYAGGMLHLIIKRLGTTTSTSPAYASRTNATTAWRPTLTLDWLAFQSPLPRAAIASFVGRGHTYYISPSGNDSTGVGSQGNPWKSIGYARSKLRPGDTLLVRDGTYTEYIDNSKHPTVNGTKVKPITVMNYPGETVWLRGILRHATNGAHWHYIGINVEWYVGAITGTRGDNGGAYTATPTIGDHMVKLDQPDCSWLQSELKNAQSFAAIVLEDGALRCRVAYCHIHDTIPSNGVDQDHCIYLAGGVECIIERNIVYGAANGRAVKIGPAASNRQLMLPDGNIIRNNVLVGVYGAAVSASYRSRNNVVEGNIMGIINDANADGIGEGNVLGILRLGESIDGGTTPGYGENNVYKNNVIFASAGAVDPNGTNNSVLNWIDGGGNVTALATANYPQFYDIAGRNFQMQSTSPAFGFGRWV